VRTDRQIVKIFLSEILFIEGLKEYITIHTLSKKVITLQNLKRMEEVLPKNRFVRVHKSFIIAIDKIDTVSKNRINIKNNYIPVGDTFKDSFFSLLNDKNML
jgi:DNA-binding LytR/AlgR family response regulator